MKKRVLLLVILMLSTCGCAVEYNLEIDYNNNYNETTTFISEGNERYPNNELYSMYLEEYPVYESEEFLYNTPNSKLEEYTYYNKSISPNNYGYVATYKASFNNDSYKDSRMMVTSFKNQNIGYNVSDRYYYIELSNLKILHADNDITNVKVNINLSNRYVVLSHNANSVNNDTYTWNFDSVNSNLMFRYQDRDIYNEINSNNEVEKPDIVVDEQDSNEKKPSKLVALIISLSVVLYFVVIIVVITRKSKN